MPIKRKTFNKYAAKPTELEENIKINKSKMVKSNRAVWRPSKHTKYLFNKMFERWHSNEI